MGSRELVSSVLKAVSSASVFAFSPSMSDSRPQTWSARSPLVTGAGWRGWWLSGSDVEESTRRFITLVDVLYDQRRLLVADTAVPLPSLFGTSPRLHDTPHRAASDRAAASSQCLI